MKADCWSWACCAIELFCGLRGAVFYIAIRKYVYNMPLEIDVEATVRATVANFFEGALGAAR